MTSSLSGSSRWSVGQNIEQALQRGRRSSIELFTRLRTASVGRASNLRRNRNVPNLDPNGSSPTHNGMPKNLSAPSMDTWIEEVRSHGNNPNPSLQQHMLSPDRHQQPKRKSIYDLKLEEKVWQRQGNDHMAIVLSALYAKLLVVCGTGFSLSEVISSYIPMAFYDGFYIYLYFMSILFMTGILGRVVQEKASKHARTFAQGVSRQSLRLSRIRTTSNNETSNPKKPPTLPPHMEESFSITSSSESTPSTPRQIPASGCQNPLHSTNGEVVQVKKMRISREKAPHFGSFYLRMGAVAFGVGSMIYAGLEFGQYFELQDLPDQQKCSSTMVAFTPAVRMIFTFMQMYFIFLNSKMAGSKASLLSTFGLMHLIGTNLCIWLNVLVQETKHEILTFYDPDNNTFSFRYEKAHKAYLSDHHHREARGLKGPHTMSECGRTNIMGSIVQDAAPFLYPCTVEFSLISAAICFVMWKSFAKRRFAQTQKKSRYHTPVNFSPSINSRSPHHYSVDCARANKGLFVGIFFLVLTLISIIINLVLDSRPQYRDVGNLEVAVTEILLYSSSSLAVLLGMRQMRVLRYAKQRNLELDNILLIVAQTGSLIFNVFTIISGHFKGEGLVLAVALSKVIQLLLQTLFILDASHRAAATTEQARRKPGREVVTYLLVINLAMWLMNALEKSRGESHPAQLQFYGVWGWTIITHISMPLAIFYRFHSTVCLCEIWKRAFKLKRH